MKSLIDQTQPGLLVRPLLGFLTLLSFLYGAVCWLRLFLYRTGLLKTRRLGAFVISVGNLTVGGTGKTPFVIALSESLSRKGLKVGVLSRGYKGRRSDDLQWVSEGEALLAEAAEVGEEPYLIAARLKKVPVVVGKDRYRSGRALLARFRLDAVLLDDGFQHLRLHRDMDLLLIDAKLPFGPPQAKGRLLPRGFLRESLRGISRASAILVTRMEQCDPSQAEWTEIERAIRHYDAKIPVFKVFFKPTALIELPSGRQRDVTFMKGRAVMGFSGIGHPASFRYFLERLGASLAAEVVFPDHHEYSHDEVERLIQIARSKGAEVLVTTEKDAVKVKPFLVPGDPVWALRIELDRIEDTQVWDRFIHEKVKTV